MNSIIQHYIIDLSSNNNFVQFSTMQGDGNNVRKIEIELIQNNTQYVIDKNDVTAIIAGIKPDGFEIFNLCDITDDGYIIVDVDSQMSSSYGKAEYSIMILDRNSNTKITSFPFNIITTKATYNPNEIISTNEFTALTEALSKANRDYTYVMENAQASADAAKLSETNAKNSEINAKSSETKAKTSETNAKKSETNSKDSETNAKTSEINADESATSASTSASTATTKANEASISASEALSSQNAAKLSETNAKTSEENAKESETNTKASENIVLTNVSTAIEKANEASVSANEAETSASEAKISETNAKKSEINAKESETKAYSSELNAKESENNASESLSTAIEKANEATTSATNAKESETNAYNYASSASESATSASNSENIATIKANEASESATSASTSASVAITKANEITDYATKSESYAKGGTGTRENEDVDNAKYYYEQSKRISEGLNGTLLPMGTITFSQLNLTTKQSGYMYNISDSFITDDTFNEGSGYEYPAGTNVYYTADGKWDCLAGTMVTGIKGDSESTYRIGNVNITKSDIGLDKVQNKTSEEIRDEITKENVSNALGYIPTNEIITDSEPTSDFWLQEY